MFLRKSLLQHDGATAECPGWPDGFPHTDQAWKVHQQIPAHKGDGVKAVRPLWVQLLLLDNPSILTNYFPPDHEYNLEPCRLWVILFYLGVKRYCLM